MNDFLSRFQAILHRHHERHAHHHHIDRRHAGRHGAGLSRPGHRGGPRGFGQGPMGGAGGIGAGRKFSAADLQLLILALLSEKPAHGYEFIKALGERSNGFYVPSPGVVYPALTYLEEIGQATVELDGTKKRYTITADGLTQLEQHRSVVDALLAQLAWIGQRMDDVRRAMGAEFPQGSGAGDGADFDAPGALSGRRHGRPVHEVDEVRQARRNLKSALIEKSGATLAEQRRIAEVLERAAAEIRGV